MAMSRACVQQPVYPRRAPVPPLLPQWTELPPGHFISGRTPKLQQFALTPEQLTIRDAYERSMDEELSSPRAYGSLGASSSYGLDDQLRRSLSLERNRDEMHVY